MDNLKYYNDSLAYDFKMFEEKKSVKKDNIVKMSSKRTSKRRRNKYVALIFTKLTSVLCAAMVLALICGNIYLRARISETTAKINDVKQQIELYDSEVTRLNVEYEKIISYNNLEVAAHELGMKKMDKAQVVYIRVNDTDAAKTSDGMLINANE